MNSPESRNRALEARPICWLRAFVGLWTALFAMEWFLMDGIARVVPEFGHVPAYYRLIRDHDAPTLPIFAAVALVAMAMATKWSRAAGVTGFVARRPRILAGLATLVYAIGSLAVYRGIPIAMDEYAPLFQSAIFLEGRLRGAVPADLVDAVVPEAFQGAFFMVRHADGAVASRYWPAFALLQVPFTAVGANWLFNPVVTGCTLLALDSLMRTLALKEHARGLALLLTLASPAIAVNAMSLYAMPLLLLCSIVFTRLILSCSPGALVAAGFVGSVALTATNPLPHALYAGTWLAWLFTRPGRGIRDVAWLALGYAPLAVVLGAGWVGFLRGFDPPGTGAVGMDPSSMLAVFTWPSIDVVVARAFAIAKLDLWGVPGLLPLAAIAPIFIRNKTIEWFAAAAAVALAGYLFVPYDQGHGWGYRYFHQAWLTLPILAAAAIEAFSGATTNRTRLAAYMTAAALLALTVLLPLRIWQVEQFASAHLGQLPPRSAIADTLRIVFVDTRCGSYTADLVQNDPLLRGHELRFVSRGSEFDRDVAVRFLVEPAIVGRSACATLWTQVDAPADGSKEGRQPRGP